MRNDCDNKRSRLAGTCLRPSRGILALERTWQNLGLNGRAVLKSYIGNCVHQRIGKFQIMKPGFSILRRDHETLGTPLLDSVPLRVPRPPFAFTLAILTFGFGFEHGGFGPCRSIAVKIGSSGCFGFGDLSEVCALGPTVSFDFIPK